MIDRQVAQMVRLIDDLLDVSRISRGNACSSAGNASSWRWCVQSAPWRRAAR